MALHSAVVKREYIKKVEIYFVPDEVTFKHTHKLVEN